MSTSPAFLKGLFGAPDDDPLLQPSRPIEASNAEPPRTATDSRVDSPQKPSPSAEPTLMNPTSTVSTRTETVRLPSSSLFDRIKDVMETTATPAPNGDGQAQSPSASRYRVRPHYVSPRPHSSTDAEDAPSPQPSPRLATDRPNKQEDEARTNRRIMQVRNGEHEPRDLATINDALNDGWCVETVRSASSGDTLVDVVLRQRRSPSLFDFGDTDP